MINITSNWNESYSLNFKNGEKPYVRNGESRDLYLKQKRFTFIAKGAALLVMTPLVQAIRLVKDAIIIPFALVTALVIPEKLIGNRWAFIRGELTHLFGAPFLVIAQEAALLYGILFSPQNGAKLYAQLEKTLSRSKIWDEDGMPRREHFFLAPCFHPITIGQLTRRAAIPLGDLRRVPIL